ncbi:MAG: phosphocholine cytidylyltransferase family protein [Candidatus Paceibacterota bacterium]
MKAIILAAGMGKRLGKYTANLPKGMLSFRGETLIERQVRTLRSCGIKDISIVTGYEAKKITIPDVKYYHNKRYAETNMVESLFCAEKELKGDVLIAYSDIIYEDRVIKQMIESLADIGVAADEDYQGYWKARLDNETDDLESLVVASGQIIELGVPCGPDKAALRYVGLIKLSSKGVANIKEVYTENRKRFFDSSAPWLGSKSFKQGYMTSLLQATINAGHEVKPVVIRRGWMEFDTENDYERAEVWANKGSLGRFIKL